MNCIQQQSEHDCGAACLAAISAHYGRFVSLAEVRALLPPEEASVADIEYAGMELGFEIACIHAMDTQLAEAQLPCIALITGKNELPHYIVVYKELPETTETFYPLPSVSFPLDSVLTRPAKVAILVDEFGGSSTEYFFYLARQSKKAITYGRPTIGMMDYAGMSNPTKLPFDAFRLYIPIEKSAWTDENPIDKTGFTPQIMINREQENWIDYVMEDLPKM